MKTLVEKIVFGPKGDQVKFREVSEADIQTLEDELHFPIPTELKSFYREKDSFYYWARGLKEEDTNVVISADLFKVDLDYNFHQFPLHDFLSSSIGDVVVDGDFEIPEVWGGELILIVVDGSLTVNGKMRYSYYVIGDVVFDFLWMNGRQKCLGEEEVRFLQSETAEDHESSLISKPRKVSAPYFFSWFYDLSAYEFSPETCVYGLYDWHEQRYFTTENPYYLWQEAGFILQPKLVWNLEDIDSDEFITPELCRVACSQDYGNALEYVPLSMRTEELCRIAVGRDGENLAFVPDSLKTIPICITALLDDAKNLRFIPYELYPMLFEELLRKFSNRYKLGFIYRGKGIGAFQEGDYQAAIQYFQKVQSLDEDDIVLYPFYETKALLLDRLSKLDSKYETRLKQFLGKIRKLRWDDTPFLSEEFRTRFGW